MVTARALAPAGKADRMARRNAVIAIAPRPGPKGAAKADLDSLAADPMALRVNALTAPKGVVKADPASPVVALAAAPSKLHWVNSNSTRSKPSRPSRSVKALKRRCAT